MLNNPGSVQIKTGKIAPQVNELHKPGAQGIILGTQGKAEGANQHKIILTALIYHGTREQHVKHILMINRII